MALRLDALQEAAEAVLGCVCAALQQTADEVEGHPGCPCRSCIVPGTPAWDSCDDPCNQNPTGGAGGQLTVNVVRLYPWADFPAPDRDSRGGLAMAGRRCQPPTPGAVEVKVTLLRCAPTFDERGCPPTCDALGEAALILHRDMATVYNALMCCLPETSGRRKGRQFVMGQMRTIGPEGMCVGLEQFVTVALPACSCPSGESP
ncbi:hypothetical protein B0E38_01839 [Streptomyces sp. 111WW2]|uniref:hypothetical protein n=1 Tax=Streptomyces sp. 111WW2 TaxID=1945515 RepID=UPI000D0C9677|nr:hypothetical protein [Streptomyces sp. 111WW2]PSK57994.1 hypothetical protein B0E38_01839 [Streptomyces sp. 111WW2]